ncbi:hypothetical protein BDN67DRAFT_1004314 [Paxillus ammoniavirescens]|nr:hypothetical protein BDN67DRAFT_1004314 [Paxillus ammoniavirescens]
MSTSQVLDSSPVPIPSLRDPDALTRPLKRSASVASLPTPPRTRHKRSRSRHLSSASRHGSDDSGSASELDDDLGGGYSARIKRAKTRSKIKGTDSQGDHTEDESPDKKKRRTQEVLPGHDEEEDEEGSFWRGRSGHTSHEKEHKKPETEKEVDSSPSPALLNYRVRAPVSPPPSRRQPQIQPARAASVERAGSRSTSAAPVTPPRRLFLRPSSPSAVDAFKTPTKPKATKIWPRRDSPNNPFLVDANEKNKQRSEWDSDDEEEAVGEALVLEGTPTPAPTFEEKPTITYVFRGQKATFQNPLYGLPPQVMAAAKLPIDHPDYEAAEACPPKRLFSGSKRKTRDRSRESTSSEGVKRAKIHRSDSDHDNATSSEGERSNGSTESRKRKLLFADGDEREAVFSKPVCGGSPRRDEDVSEFSQRAREERQGRETAAKARLASREGLRAGAVVTQRDEPARRAMGPHRSA